MFSGGGAGGVWRALAETNTRGEKSCRCLEQGGAYHFIHAIALFVLALYGPANRSAWWLLFAGIIIFSGSLYVMGLTGVRWLGAITPLGGLCFLAGWAWLVISPPAR